MRVATVPIIGTLLLSVLTTPCVVAQTSSLTGLSVVNVEVRTTEDQPSEREELQRSVENSLRDCGLRLMTREEWNRNQNPGNPIFLVIVQANPPYMISSQLIERGKLERGNGAWIAIISWTRNDAGRSENMKATVSLQAATFCKEWSDANPKTSR